MHARRASRDDAALRRLSVRTARVPVEDGCHPVHGWLRQQRLRRDVRQRARRELVAAVDEVAAHQQVRAHEQHGKHRDERPERYERREPQLQQLAGARREALQALVLQRARFPQLLRLHASRAIVPREPRRGVARLAPAVAAGVVAGALARATAALDRLATFQLLRERGGQTVLGGRVVVPGRRRAPRRRRGSEASRGRLVSRGATHRGRDARRAARGGARHPRATRGPRLVRER